MNATSQFLEHKAYKLRELSLNMTTKAASGHPTSCLSSADLVAAIFFDAMQFDPHHFSNPDNDRFVLSKGHAAPLLYAVWHELGLISQSELMTYRDANSILEGHPTKRFPYAEVATGSLGMGLSYGAGMALAAKQEGRTCKTFVVLGDSELAEGSIWEAAEIAHYYKLHNLIAVVDCNRLGQSTETMHGFHVTRYEEKFKAFGWRVITIDGHSMQQITSALQHARESSDAPVMIIAKTFKGYGVKAVEDKPGFHGKAFTAEELEGIIPALQQRFASAYQYEGDGVWEPKIPVTVRVAEQSCSDVSMPVPAYQQGELVATRKAYGTSLVELGRKCHAVVSLDAEVKNSTYAELFEKHFPERFFQCFIAEQNMVSMAVGMQVRGKVPFVSTFSAFMSRAYDQIRMAAIGQSPLRLVGSHAGVSIGQDGPSQMGLEDIACMRALPKSVVLYPCDAVSTYRLVELMGRHEDGISYLRTTREVTPVIYQAHEEFPLGGCKVLRQSSGDVACLVAAGITVHEALKACDMLQQQGIYVAVIDAYSIKPLDAPTIRAVAQQSGNTVITIEDHYAQGGLGEAVAHALSDALVHVHIMAVEQLPRSGKPQEMLAWAGIDAVAIVKKVLSL